MATSTSPWSTVCLSGVKKHCWSFPVGNRRETETEKWTEEDVKCKVWRRSGKVQICVSMHRRTERLSRQIQITGNKLDGNKRKDGGGGVPDNSYYLPPPSSKRHCHHLAATTWVSKGRRDTSKGEFQSSRIALEFTDFPDIISGILLRSNTNQWVKTHTICPSSRLPLAVWFLLQEKHRNCPKRVKEGNSEG